MVIQVQINVLIYNTVLIKVVLSIYTKAPVGLALLLKLMPAPMNIYFQNSQLDNMLLKPNLLPFKRLMKMLSPIPSLMFKVPPSLSTPQLLVFQVLTKTQRYITLFHNQVRLDSMMVTLVMIKPRKTVVATPITSPTLLQVLTP